MPVGTNLGQSFNQGYGQGTSEILDSSSTVNVARDIYGQEAQWGKVKQAEKRQDRNDADKMINTPVDFWAKDKDVLMPKYNELLDKAARFRSKVDNPFTGYSSDPEVQEFQKEWRNFKSMTAQSALERSEFEKYQAKLFDKNSNSLADDSKKQLDEYYSKPISERWGKVAPQMRVKDPHANIYSFASEIVKASEKKEYTPEEIDNLVNLQSDAAKNPQAAEQVATYAKQAFDNYTPQMKQAALEKFGTDPQGNVNYVGMGKELLRDSLQSVANISQLDISKELYDIAKQAADFTDKRRGTDGTLFLDKNTGAVAGQTKDSIRRQIDLKIKSNGAFASALKTFYEPLIDTKGLDGLKPEDAAKEKYKRALELATNDAYNTKDQSSQAVARMSTNVRVNLPKEDKYKSDEWLNDLFSGDNAVQKQSMDALLGRNSSLGANIDRVTLKNENGINGIEISYTADNPDMNGRRTQQTEFIAGTAENNTRLLDLIEGATHAQKKSYKRIIAPQPLLEKIIPTTTPTQPSKPTQSNNKKSAY